MAFKNYKKWFDLDYEICYFFNVYGPRQIYDGKYATVVAIFENVHLFSSCQRGEPF